MTRIKYRALFLFIIFNIFFINLVFPQNEPDSSNNINVYFSSSIKWIHPVNRDHFNPLSKKYKINDFDTRQGLHYNLSIIPEKFNYIHPGLSFTFINGIKSDTIFNGTNNIYKEKHYAYAFTLGSAFGFIKLKEGYGRALVFKFGTGFNYLNTISKIDSQKSKSQKFAMSYYIDLKLHHPSGLDILMGYYKLDYYNYLAIGISFTF